MVSYLFVLLVGVFYFLTPMSLSLAGEEEISIKRIITNPIHYDGREVMVEGEVIKLKYTTSTSGKPYTLFQLDDGNENTIGVYTKGKIQIAEGNKVRVMGRFKKEKRYAIFKFKNVIKASEVEKTG